MEASIKDILSDVSTSKIDADFTDDHGKDLFGVHKRHAWDRTTEARCDFTYMLKLTRRSEVNFISIWKKSLYGRTLTDIKSDPAMVSHFADNIVPVISETLGTSLAHGGWCIVTSPKRRHREKNFATMICEKIASMLGIPFYEDVAECRTKQRMNAVFTLNYLPEEPNIIVFDDFVTTGNTLASMKRLLQPLGKNLVFFAGINNKL